MYHDLSIQSHEFFSKKLSKASPNGWKICVTYFSNDKTYVIFILYKVCCSVQDISFLCKTKSSIRSHFRTKQPYLSLNSISEKSNQLQPCFIQFKYIFQPHFLQLYFKMELVFDFDETSQELFCKRRKRKKDQYLEN